MSKKKEDKKIAILAIIVLAILYLVSNSNNPIFLGSLTSFTQSGNELKFTQEVIENQSGTIRRTLMLDHGNITSAYMDVFVTPTINDSSIYIEDNLIYEQTEEFVNVERFDIGSLLEKESCKNCIVEFFFKSNMTGSILITELNVEYGGDPNPIEETETEETNQEEIIQENDVQIMAQTESNNSTTIVFYVLIGILIYLFWEKGKNKGFLKSI